MRIWLFLALAAAAWAAPPRQGPPKGAAANSLAALEATGYFDAESVKAVLGHDPGASLLVVEVELKPAAGQALSVVLDDFLLRSDRNGQRAQPMTPSQIAGSAVMVVSSRGGQQGTPMGENRGPVFGIPGIPGSSRVPRSLPGQSPTGGAATADTSSATASVDDRTGARKDSPLLAVLKERILPEKETAAPVKGLLYFLIEGKQRPKDMELLYKTAQGRLSVRFKEPK